MQDGFPTSWRNPTDFDLATAHWRAVNLNAVHPSVERWNFGLQRLLPFDTTLTINYVGTKATHLT
jgi:hypothetical protein